MILATLLGLPPLTWFLIFFGAGWLVLGTFAGFFFGRFIAIGEAPIETDHSLVFTEPESPADLDDWLAGTSLDFDFKVWKRPVASTEWSAR